jgi:hypothetical protein
MDGWINTSITSCQFAYRRGLSTVDALVNAIDDWTSGLDNINNKFIQSAMLDFSKAFDRLQPAVLIQKLHSLNINSSIISVIDSFLSDRVQCVAKNGFRSSFEPISVGTPQGTRLGPVLWLFYVNDLASNDYSLIKYADDTTYYTAIKKEKKTVMETGDDQKREMAQKKHPSPIQHAIEGAKQWSSENNMLLNLKKTVVMNISLRNKVFSDDIILDGTILDTVASTKILGVIIDEGLSFSDAC